MGNLGPLPSRRVCLDTLLERQIFCGLFLLVVLNLAGCRAAPPPAGDQVSPPLRATTVAGGFDTLWDMALLPGGKAMLVSERVGRVSRVDLKTGKKTVLLHLKVWAQTEAGLMGLALSPRFARDQRVFLCYTHATPAGPRNRVSRFTLKGGQLVEETPVLAGMKGQHIHNGCRLRFAPDGLLYITMGDAAAQGSAQDAKSLNGKVLRVRPDGSIPPGNLAPDSPVFTWGHRNPQGLAFHPKTGRAYVSEHGPDRNDEINLLVVGKNYGWPLTGGKPGDGRFEDALHAWTPTLAVAGMAFYQGGVFRGWRGDLLVTTLKERDLRRIRLAGPDYRRVVFEEVLLDGELGRLRAVLVGPSGEVYVATSNRDGRGAPGPQDDRIVKVSPAR